MTVPLDSMVAAEYQIVAEHQLREKVINEEFKIWKKTVPLLYDSIHTQVLEYPLLSVQFLPDYAVSENKNTITVQLALGTNSSGRGQDYVRLASLDLPSTLAPDFSKFAVGESIPIPMSDSGSFKILQSWKHPGEVNKLQVSPDGAKIATFDNAGVVHIYNLKDESPVDYVYHTSEGYCLEWVSNSQFLSGANDAKIALWDVGKPEPIKKFTSHSAVINDLSYSTPAKVLFGSVSDDFTTQIHDLRAPEESPAIKIADKHIQNAIGFHPVISTLVATGGKDNVVTLYDLRNPKEPLRKFFGHNDSVVGVKWDPGHEPTYLYSWGLDKRVVTWDLNSLQEEFTYPTADAESKRKPKSTEDPCLKFIHGGHTNRINDVAVHPAVPALFTSVGDDTLLELYKPKSLLEEEDEDEEEDENEKSREEKKEEEGEKEKEEDEEMKE